MSEEKEIKELEIELQKADRKLKKSRRKLKNEIFNYAFIISLFVIKVMVFRWLWNMVIIEVFEFHSINFWQAMGMFMLGNLVFKGGKIKGKIKF